MRVQLHVSIVYNNFAKVSSTFCSPSPLSKGRWMSKLWNPCDLGHDMRMQLHVSIVYNNLAKLSSTFRPPAAHSKGPWVSKMRNPFGYHLALDLRKIVTCEHRTRHMKQTSSTLCSPNGAKTGPKAGNKAGSKAGAEDGTGKSLAAEPQLHRLRRRPEGQHLWMNSSTPLSR